LLLVLAAGLKLSDAPTGLTIGEQECAERQPARPDLVQTTRVSNSAVAVAVLERAIL
jgi:hypothetical protein